MTATKKCSSVVGVLCVQQIKIYGAPGTGKTTRMLDLLSKEMEAGTPVERIAFVTHTVAARREALDRASAFTKVDDLKYFRTIHGICYAQIGLRRDNVMQADDYLAFAEQYGIRFSESFTRDLDTDGLPLGYAHSPGNEILAVRQLAAAKMCSIRDVAADWPAGVDTSTMREVLEGYRKWKEHNAKFDFVDMLQMYARLGEPIDVDVVFLDEAQDLSLQQWAIFRQMIKKAKRVYIAGDDDQSIYAFIGADPYGFLDYETDASEILPKTWRLKDKVWNYAQRIIGQVHRRQKKEISTSGPGGQIDFYNVDIRHIPIDDSGSTMFISRHNSQLDDFADELRSRGIPFDGRGWTPYGSRQVSAVTAFLALREGKPIGLRDAALVLDTLKDKERAKVYRNRARSEPQATVAEIAGVDTGADWVRYLARNTADLKRNEFIRDVLRNLGVKGILEPPKVSLTTYHGSKGREADHVVLMTDCFRKAYDHARIYPDDERRLAYVGVTRARKKLSIILPQTDMFMRSIVS